MSDETDENADDIVEERIVGGIVLRPQKSKDDVKDLQGDYYDEDDIYFAAHYFMEGYWNGGDHGMRVMHKGRVVNDKIRILESYIAPVNFSVKKNTIGDDGDEDVAIDKGSWVMIVKILDDDLWNDVKEGGFSGFSIGGTAKTAKVELVESTD